MKTLLIAATIMGTLSLIPDTLTGRWETKPSSNGNTTGIVFKSDNSFDAYINRKPFTSGNYVLTDSIFSFTDNGCNGVRGIYKIHLFSNNDSLRFEAVADSCTERKNGMSRLIFGKIK